MTPIGRMLREARHARGLSPEQVAVRMGYRKHRKGGRKNMAIEAPGLASEDTLALLAEVLGLDWCEVLELLLPA